MAAHRLGERTGIIGKRADITSKLSLLVKNPDYTQIPGLYSRQSLAGTVSCAYD
jgi:hypothetical protein